MMSPAPPRKLDYADYAAIPDDGKRYEVLEGSLFVTPAPSSGHQHASKRLFRQLEDYFEARALGEAFFAPMDVILGPHDIVQPDLVVARPEQVSERGIEGAPLLVVEVLSPSTREHDRKRKAARYAALGVAHCWIVDPEARSLECYRTERGWCVLAARGAGADVVTHPDWPGLRIELASLWR
jgi:Uma2 family endonuclease